MNPSPPIPQAIMRLLPTPYVQDGFAFYVFNFPQFIIDFSIFVVYCSQHVMLCLDVPTRRC